MRHTLSYRVWNFLFSAFFLIVLGMATAYLGNGDAFPRAVPWFDAIMMVFATLRITRLIVYDRITLWFRELFFEPKTGFMQVVIDLLQCPWCIGIWAGLVVAFCYFVFPWAWFVIFFLALAGAGSLLQVSANAIGWRAEHLKKSTEML
jgi:hypothetical protein